jgi:hypothetical protein
MWFSVLNPVVYVTFLNSPWIKSYNQKCTVEFCRASKMPKIKFTSAPSPSRPSPYPPPPPPPPPPLLHPPRPPRPPRLPPHHPRPPSPHPHPSSSLPPPPPPPTNHPHSHGGSSTFVVSATASQPRLNPSLRRLYPRGRNLHQPTTPLVRFPPLSDFAEAAQIQDPQINRPEDIDLDSACFMMLTQDLPALFGIMIRPANRKVKVKDLPEFDDWLHVVSDPIVVKVYVGSTEEERTEFKNTLLSILRVKFGMTLTTHVDSLTLSRNQVNVPFVEISEALHYLGARFCRVQFFGMKWGLPVAERTLDRFIARYYAEMGTDVPTGKNVFDYGRYIQLDQLELYTFSFQQHQLRYYQGGYVHQMCDVPDYGSLDFSPSLEPCVEKIKIYQKVVHELLSKIQKQCLDDMPSQIRTIRTRVQQLQSLLAIWEAMPPITQSSHLLGTRIEATVSCTDLVIDGRRLLSEKNLLHMVGIERALGGAFDVHRISLQVFITLL